MNDPLYFATAVSYIRKMFMKSATGVSVGS
jgi:hypothetical protein